MCCLSPSVCGMLSQRLEWMNTAAVVSAPDIQEFGRPRYSFVLGLAVFSCSVMSDSVTPWTVACQAPLSMGNLQARILELVAMSSSRGSSQPRDQTQDSYVAGGFFYHLSHQESSRNSQGTISKPRQAGCSLCYTFLHFSSQFH